MRGTCVTFVSYRSGLDAAKPTYFVVIRFLFGLSSPSSCSFAFAFPFDFPSCSFPFSSADEETVELVAVFESASEYAVIFGTVGEGEGEVLASGRREPLAIGSS